MAALKIEPYTQYDRYVMVVLLIPYILGINAAIYGYRLFSSAKIFWPAAGLTTLFLIVVYGTMGIIAVKYRNRFPEYRQTVTRLSFMIGTFIPLTAVMTLSYYWLLSHFSILGCEWNTASARWLLMVGALANILATALNEGVYTFEKWKGTMVETEELQKSNLQSRLESLKNQVNPHFLFNSLNSLSSLINENPDQAEQFLNEMTKVYRYLLRNNEQELTHLSTEMKFIQSYFHLLKTRYGEGIELNCKVSPEYEKYLIPPLTLQLLVENAVKHNIILREKPLQISIETDHDHKIIIKNKLQRKTIHVNSNKVGLHNIADKYRLMNKGEIVVKEDDGNFTVTIPLIEPAS